LDKILSTSLSLLHKSLLKPQGFSKKAATFSREHETYVELFNIQSSNWNGPSGKCFYVNCGLRFNDLPLGFSGMYFPGTQWAGRIQSLVPGLKDQWGYDEVTVDSIMKKLGSSIFLASAELSNNLAKYKDQYLLQAKEILAHRAGLQA
jgi:hypothetical protein